MVFAARPLSRTLVMVAIALVAFGIAIFAWRSASAKTVAVEGGNNYFCSAAFDGSACTTNVSAGDTITWTIVGGTHTVTECNDDFSQCPPAGGWDSGIVAKDDTFSQTFLNAGVFEYRCELHPSEMLGYINVLHFDPTAAPTASPTAAPTDQVTVGPSSSVAATAATLPKSGGPLGRQLNDDDDTLLFTIAFVLATGGVFALAFASKR